MFHVEQRASGIRGRCSTWNTLSAGVVVQEGSGCLCSTWNSYPAQQVRGVATELRAKRPVGMR